MNRIIASLSPDGQSRFNGAVEPVVLSDGAVLYQPGAPIDRVYFPTTTVVSIVQVMEEGYAAEVGMVGREGVCGLDLILRNGPATGRSLCQVPGEAQAIPAAGFRRLVSEDPILLRALLSYTGGYCAMLAQLIACNRLHRVEQRCARWLLMTVDRLARYEFPMTQDRLSMMLGAQRPTVTATMASLRDAGCLEYNRGEVRISDRAKLEKFACECYAVCASYFEF
jgi:CRP-like cAMP-binding protein